jgi:hypothetical protein
MLEQKVDGMSEQVAHVSQVHVIAMNVASRALNFMHFIATKYHIRCAR